MTIRDGEAPAADAPARHVFEVTHDDGTRPLRNVVVSSAVARLASKLGAKDVAPFGRWTPHDLRRTMRTGLSACRVQPHIAELAIGHSKTGMVALYGQHDHAVKLRAAMRAWEARLLTIIDGQDPDRVEGGNVIQLGARR